MKHAPFCTAKPSGALVPLWYTSNAFNAGLLSVPAETTREGIPNMPDLSLNSRTFIRNIKPTIYPAGTRAGMDWAAPGGIYDNTDPRNPTYWGPPRIMNGDPVFGLLPAETPANGERRLKMEGYVGMYSARAEAERKRQDATAARAEPVGLEKIIAAAAESRARQTLTVLPVGEGGRRKTRAELRADTRRRGREDVLTGIITPVAPVASGGGDSFGDETEDTTEETTEADEEAEPEPTAAPAPVSAPTPAPVEPAPPAVAPPGPTVSRETPTPPTEPATPATNAQPVPPDPDAKTEGDAPAPDEDAPVGGGGNAATLRDAPPEPAPAVMPPLARSGGNAGRGARRPATAPEPTPAPA